MKGGRAGFIDLLQIRRSFLRAMCANQQLPADPLPTVRFAGEHVGHMSIIRYKPSHLLLYRREISNPTMTTYSVLVNAGIQLRAITKRHLSADPLPTAHSTEEHIDYTSIIRYTPSYLLLYRSEIGNFMITNAQRVGECGNPSLCYERNRTTRDMFLTNS